MRKLVLATLSALLFVITFYHASLAGRKEILDLSILSHGSALRTVSSTSHAGGAETSEQREATTVWQGPDEYPRNATVMLTFCNGPYFQLALNWVQHVNLLGLAYILAALDDVAQQKCQQHGLHCVFVNAGLNSSNFRNDYLGQFRKMGAHKPLMVEHLLQMGFSSVILSDTDTAWLRDPQPLFNMHPEADIMVSTDCLSHRAERLVDNWPYTPRCGHVPGATCCAALNTGVVVFRSTNRTANAVRQWYKQLTDNNKQLESKDQTYLWRMTDQLEFNTMMATGKSMPWASASEQDPHVVWMWERGVRVLPLPVLVAANGHTMFIQRLHDKHKVVPYVVHATFQRHELNGKIARFRESGMWLMDDDDYYNNDDQRYLTYANDVHAVVDAAEKAWVEQHVNVTEMARLHKHMVAFAYQLAIAQEALALGRVLNRTVIFPQMYCWCDQDRYPTVLRTCGIEGSDFPNIPFGCPLDTFFNPKQLDAQGFEYRTSGFLSNPRVLPRIRNSRSAVIVVLTEDEMRDARLLDIAEEVLLMAGSQEQVVQTAFLPFAHVRVLDFVNLLPGAFGGFSLQQAAEHFDHAFSLLSEYYWCCGVLKMDAVQWKFGPFRYALQPPLGWRNGYPGPWQVPPSVYERPTWCESKEVDQQNLPYLFEPNHPCSYLNVTRKDMAIAA